MSWIKENKFLAGFTAATVVGAGTIGFLLLQAKGRYEEANSAFEQESAELSRLQGLQPFPNAANVKKIEEQRNTFREAVAKMQTGLAQADVPVDETVSAQQLQDRVRQTVDSITKQAAEKNVTLGEKTAGLGFERYLAEPPAREAAGPLARQLSAVEKFVSSLINTQGVVSLTELSREELPEEKGGAARAEAEPPKGGKKDQPGKGAVSTLGFQVKFLTAQGGLLNVLNNVASSQKPFLIPRVVTVSNEEKTGPARALTLPPQPATPALNPDGTPVAAAAPAPATPAAPAGAVAGAATGPQASPYIVGDERIEVSMRIEIADFPEIQQKATAAK